MEIISPESSPEQARTVEINPEAHYAWDDLLQEKELDKPIASNKHFLDQLCDAGFFKTTPVLSRGLSVLDMASPTRQPLYAAVAINDLPSILDSGSFQMRYRLYLMWSVDLEEAGLQTLAAKARAKGHWYSASDKEIEEISSKVVLPNVSIFNQVTSESYDAQSIRVYGGVEGKSALLWNQAWVVTLKESFELKHFPFDVQALQIELRQNDPKTWDLFDLHVHLVQFHKLALELTEWHMLEPTVTRGSPPEKSTNVALHIRRCALYYVQNVAIALLLLTSLGLVTFAMDVHDLGNRVGTCLTLILSSIAFKFILASTLPKVPYNTVIDYYVLASTFSLCLMTWLGICPQFAANSTGDIDFGNRINRFMMIISVVMVVGSFVIWAVCATVISFTNTGLKRIKLVKGKNWYAFNFSLPTFMQGRCEHLCKAGVNL